MVGQLLVTSRCAPGTERSLLNLSFLNPRGVNPPPVLVRRLLGTLRLVRPDKEHVVNAIFEKVVVLAGQNLLNRLLFALFVGIGVPDSHTDGPFVVPVPEVFNLEILTECVDQALILTVNHV